MDEIPRKDCKMVFLVFEGGPLHCPKNPKNDEIHCEMLRFSDCFHSLIPSRSNDKSRLSTVKSSLINIFMVFTQVY